MIRGAIGWHTKAACKGADTDQFYSVDERHVQACFTICGRCEVATECLIWALEAEEQFGIWGGKTPLQRRLLQPTRPVLWRCAQCLRIFENPRGKTNQRNYCTEECAAISRRDWDAERKRQQRGGINATTESF